MKLFHKRKVKNHILENVANSTAIEKSIQHCFAPATSMIWCHSSIDVDIHYSLSDDAEFVARLHRNLPTLKK